MVYTSQYLEIEISTFQTKTVVYWKNQTINNFKASESNVIQIIVITAIIMTKFTLNGGHFEYLDFSN